MAALEEHPGQRGKDGLQLTQLRITTIQLTPQILPGNINTYSEVENALQPIIFASKIRIYPYGQYDRTVCLRAEIVGCPWEGKSLVQLASAPRSPNRSRCPEANLNECDKNST